MKTILAISSVALACASLAEAQIGRTFDVHTAAQDSQRSGFEKSDTKFTKETVKDFKFLFKDKLEGKQKGSNYLLPPVLIGTLIGYRGFKELAFVANRTGDIWAIDVDLDRIFWERHIDLPKVKAKATASCPGGITSEPTMEPGASFGARRRSSKGKSSSSSRGEDFFRKIFAPRTLYVLASDGKLYRIDTSTGKDMTPPIDVMPPGAKAGNLNGAEGAIYATTSDGCNGVPNAVWAIDVSGDKPKVASFPATAPEGFVGRNGVLVGSDDEVYAQTSNAVQILSEKDLKLQQTFSAALSDTSPVAFTYKDRDLIVTPAKDGSLYLLDTKSLSTALCQTPPIAGDGQVTGLSSWETSEGTRWVLATISNGSIGSIVAFQLNDQDGKMSLTKSWSSPNLPNPETPVIANGVVFALSAGDTGKKGKLTGHAVLYGFDGETGKQLYNTGDQVSEPANLSGMTVANGRVFFSTTDSTFYAFGYTLEH